MRTALLIDGEWTSGAEYGLAAAIWTRDITTANRRAANVKAGTVWINMPPILDAGAAWGGVKSSGHGREMGWDAIAAFTDVRSIGPISPPSHPRARTTRGAPAHA